MNCNMRDEALQRYLKLGWPVLACHAPLSNGRCSCNNIECPSVGKHPRYHTTLLPHGVRSATLDPQLIQSWRALWSDANFAVATGKISGFFVLDKDPDHGGIISLNEVESRHGKLPETVEAITGSGGSHYLFAYPPSGSIQNIQGFLPGLDIRGDGGYIVVEPSLHASGNPYRWEAAHHPDDIEPAAAPDWLIDAIIQANVSKREFAPESGPILEGRRNDTLHRIGASMRAYGVPPDGILKALLITNKERCQPALPEKEVVRIVSSVVRYAPGTADDGARLTVNGKSLAPGRRLKMVKLSSVVPTRVDFWWKPFIPKGRPAAVEGDPGIGKSTLVAKIIAHLTTGKPFPTVLENTPPGVQFTPCNVCLLTSEDDASDTLVPRLEINGADTNKVIYVPGWEGPDGQTGAVTMRDLELLRQALDAYNPALMVFDPFQAFFGQGLDMNKANDTRPTLEAVANLCKEYECTPLYVRHIGKARRDKAVHAALGSIDITGNMRSILFLGRDPDAPERRILAHSKVNNAPLGQSLAYIIKSCEMPIPTPDGGEVIVEAPRLHWDGLSPLTANDLSAPIEREEEGKSALEQAKDFLTELLSDGPVLYAEIQAAAKTAGLSVTTLRRAKDFVGVKVTRRQENHKNAREWPWQWSLVEAPSRQSEPTVHTNGHLEHLEEAVEKKGVIREFLDDHMVI